MTNFYYEKEIIGRLIYYYRKKKNINIATFLKDNASFCKTNCTICKKTIKSSICAPKTLRKIENGIVLDDECYYLRLCNQLGRKIKLNRSIISKIQIFQNKLTDLLTCLSCPELSKLYTLISLTLRKYTNSIYIEEILNLYLDTINFQLYRKIPEKRNMEIYYAIKDYVNETDKKIILLLLCHVQFKSPTAEYSKTRIIQECKQYFDDPLFYEIKILDIAISHNSLNAYSLLKEYETEKMKNAPVYLQYIFFKTIALIQLNAKFYQASFDTMRKCLILIENNPIFNEYMLNKCYCQIGIICFQLGKYTDVTHYYLSVLDNNYFLGLNYCLLFYSLEQSNRAYEIKPIIDKIDFFSTNNQDNIVKSLIIYYKIKYSKDLDDKNHLSELENIICEDLVKIIKVGGKIYTQILVSDLTSYISITCNYKKLFIFIKNLKLLTV